VAHEVERARPDEAERNKQLLKVLTLELWSARNEGAIDRFFSEDYVQHSPFAKPGRQGVHDFFRAVTTAIPDLVVTLDHLFAEGDRVFAFLTWKGTQRLEQGRIVEHWDVVDGSGMVARDRPA
jgi:predicted SnoaL-like aldol condensation-catalyzing enzyme